MKIRFPERGRSGRLVLSLKNLEFSYEDKVIVMFHTGLFSNSSLDIAL